jgi:hypothetical protein
VGGGGYGAKKVEKKVGHLRYISSTKNFILVGKKIRKKWRKKIRQFFATITASARQRCTVKKVIGNILTSLKSASLKIKNTISSLGIFFATHSMLFTSLTAKKYSNQSDGWKSSDIWWKTAPISFDGNCRHLSENFDASVKNSRPPHWPGASRHFERGQGTTVQWIEDRRNKMRR